MGGVSILLALLTVLLWAVAALAGIIIILLLLFLFVPVSFGARAEGAFRPDDDENWDGWARWEANLRWGGALIRLSLAGTHQGLNQNRITIFGLRLSTGRKRKAAATEAEDPAKAKPRKRKKKRKRRITLEDWRSYAREGLELARRMIRNLRLVLTGDLTFGLDDPALTGLTLGALALVGRPAGLQLRPDWQQPGLEGWVAARGRLYGFEAAIALWRAYWRSPLSRPLRKRFTWPGRKNKHQEVEQHGRAG